jgi:hypothetical protein
MDKNLIPKLYFQPISLLHFLYNKKYFIELKYKVFDIKQILTATVIILVEVVFKKRVLV